MKREKEYSNIWLGFSIGIIIGLLLMFFMFYFNLGGTATNNGFEKINKTIKNNGIIYSNLTLKGIEMKPIDYSNKGYYQVQLGNQSGFMIYECINSTMKIKDNKLGCFK